MNTILLIKRNKRTDFNRGALFLCLVLIVVLLTGCTAVDPGYFIIVNSEPLEVEVIGEEAVTVVDSDGNIVTIDQATQSITIIEFEHHMVHEGDSFISDGVDTVMGNGDTLILAFKTPDTTKWPHLVIMGWALARAHVDIIEGPTWNTGTGAQEPTYNRNRNSTTTSTLLEDTTGAFLDNDALVLNPNGLAGGTVIHHFYFNAKKSGGDLSRGLIELMLKQNTTYAIRLTSYEANNAGQIELDWYEFVRFE